MHNLRCGVNDTGKKNSDFNTILYIYINCIFVQCKTLLVKKLNNWLSMKCFKRLYFLKPHRPIVEASIIALSSVTTPRSCIVFSVFEEMRPKGPLYPLLSQAV